MKTYEMVEEADKNGDTYITGSMRYQKEKGFYEEVGKGWPVYALDFKNGLSYFIHVDDWEKIKPKKLTLKEIEKLLGYEIEIVSK